MIVVMTRFNVNPEKKEIFEERMANFGENGIENQKGFISLKVLSPKTFPSMPPNNTYIIETVWEDMDSFIEYTKSEAFRKAHENPLPREVFLSPPSVEIYEVKKEK